MSARDHAAPLAQAGHKPENKTGFDDTVRLTEEEIAQRRAFLELTEDDAERIRRVHDRLEPGRRMFADSFYEHLLQFPALRQLLRDDATVERLKQAQAAYFSSLTGGDYGNDYIENRLRIGVVHQRIGLEPHWYLGAYRKYLSTLIPSLWEVLGDDPDNFLQTYGALLKIVCLDMSLALDAYIDASQREILQLKNYSEEIIGSMPSGLMVIGLDGKVSTMNRAIRRMFGVAEDAALADIPLAGIVPSPTLMAALHAGRATAGYRRSLRVTVGSANEPRNLQCSVSRAVISGQDMLLLIAEDITEAMLTRSELRESEERFRVAFAHAAVGLAYLSADGRWLRANRKMLDIVGYTESELLNMRYEDITHLDDLRLCQDAMQGLISGATTEYTAEKRYLRKDGSYVWAKVTVAPMYDKSGQVSFITAVEDISERKAMERELQQLANHDALTGLPNRTLLQDRMSQALAYAQRAGRYVAVLFIDLDRFKNINDSLGHEAGDKVLIRIARRLQASIRSDDTAARLGGDEFVVVLTDVGREEEVAGVAQKILARLSQPMLLADGAELVSSASIGISLYPKDGRDSPTLLKNADAAMYRAKYGGRNLVQFYAQEMNALTLDRLKLESGMRRALKRGEFVLHYQPQIDAVSQKIIGAEALLRWQQPGKPLLLPKDFIPIAEDTGLIVQIGEWVLREACRQQQAWCAQGADIRVAVNLSARQFRHSDLENVVARALQETGCQAARLELEITETAVMEDPEAAAQTLQRLSDMGVHLAVDDFGTGYSSLAYLKRFPIHMLKIDRSFVRDITTDPDDAAIAQSIIALAHTMKLSVTAEGVETADQKDFLRKQRCDRLQGFLFGTPLPADELAALLRQQITGDTTSG